MIDLGEEVRVKVERMNIDYANAKVHVQMILSPSVEGRFHTLPVGATLYHATNTILLQLQHPCGEVVSKSFICDGPSDYCLVKRWLCSMVQTEMLDDDGSSQQRSLSGSYTIPIEDRKLANDDIVRDEISCILPDEGIQQESSAIIYCNGAANATSDREQFPSFNSPDEGISCGATKTEIEKIRKWSRHRLPDKPSNRQHKPADALKSANNYTVYSLQQCNQQNSSAEEEDVTSQDAGGISTILTPTPPTKPLARTTMRNRRRHNHVVVNPTATATGKKLENQVLFSDADDTTHDVSLLSSASDATMDIRNVEGLKEINAKQNCIIGIQSEQIERLTKERSETMAEVERLRKENAEMGEKMNRMMAEREEMKDELAARMEEEERTAEIHRKEREMYRKLISGAKRKIEELRRRKDEILEKFVEKLVASAEENESLEDKNKELIFEVDREKRINNALLKLGHQKQHQ